MSNTSFPLLKNEFKFVNNGPPDTSVDPALAIKTPNQLGSSQSGGAIVNNLKALDYYANQMFCGDEDMKGLGVRIAYDTGRRCSNLPGKTVYNYLDGTKSKVPEAIAKRLGTSCAANGVIPQVLGALTDFNPDTLIQSGNIGAVYCDEVVAPINTPEEIKELKASGVIPKSNKTSIPYKNDGNIDWNQIRNYCSRGIFKNCQRITVESDSKPGNEGFNSNMNISTNNSLLNNTLLTNTLFNNTVFSNEFIIFVVLAIILI